MSEPFGLTSTYLLSASGVLAHVPHRVPSQGITLTRLRWDGAVLILPIAAVEDPAFGPLLNQDGVYRIEDASGQIARIGQGRVIDRVRRHRARPIVFPHRLIAATPIKTPWSVAERCYLEERLADHWLAAGHALASSTFMREHPMLPLAGRATMDGVLAEIVDLLAEGLRLEERGNPLRFMPHDPPSATRPFGVGATFYRRFAAGTELEFRNARILARAIARRHDVLLLPGSLIHLEPTTHVGVLFRRQHTQFVAAAEVEDVGGGIGRTRRPISSPTAASLLKRTTGGRSHNADKWRPRTSTI